MIEMVKVTADFGTSNWQVGNLALSGFPKRNHAQLQ